MLHCILNLQELCRVQKTGISGISEELIMKLSIPLFMEMMKLEHYKNCFFQNNLEVHFKQIFNKFPNLIYKSECWRYGETCFIACFLLE